MNLVEEQIDREIKECVKIIRIDKGGEYSQKCVLNSVQRKELLINLLILRNC